MLYIYLDMWSLYFSTVSKVLITTGYPRKSGTKAEVIDLENSNVVCKDLDDFPLETYYAVGANLASKPIICGGYLYSNHTSSDKCFTYKEGVWKHFATMLESPIPWKCVHCSAAGIVIDNDFYIFGGFV